MRSTIEYILLHHRRKEGILEEIKIDAVETELAQ
jgi:hypothetical protein